MKIKIISPYFGKLPSYFKFFLESCSKNPSYNFLIITDDETNFDLPRNVEIKIFKFEWFQNLIKSKIGGWAICSTPYKICDYKPAFGAIFDMFLNEFDYWGHCDIDLIWGNLDKFLKKPLNNGFDSILTNGHLILFKNNTFVNNCYRLECPKTLSFKDVYSTNISCGFDENSYGITGKLNHNLFSVYKKYCFIDISIPHYNSDFFSLKQNNYENQFFSYEHGKVYHNYMINSVLKKKEYAYIHFQKRKFINFSATPQHFQISPYGFSDIKPVIQMFKYNKAKSNIFFDFKMKINDIVSSINFKLFYLKSLK